jgi:hypothetical protein
MLGNLAPIPGRATTSGEDRLARMQRPTPPTKLEGRPERCPIADGSGLGRRIRRGLASKIHMKMALALHWSGHILFFNKQCSMGKLACSE